MAREAKCGFDREMAQNAIRLTSYAMLVAGFALYAGFYQSSDGKILT